jgi:ABC-2 type transport system permease protein
MWLLSGAFFPAAGPGALAWVVCLNPLSYGVAGLRHYLQFSPGASRVVPDPGRPASPPPIDALPDLALCWIVTAVFALLMLLAAWRIAATRTAGDLQ